MSTPEFVAKGALRFVRELDLPATNWPNVPDAQGLKNVANDHKILAANHAELINSIEAKAMQFVELFPRFRGVKLQRPSTEQALAIGGYYAANRTCTSMNCGERTGIAFWYAHTFQEYVGAMCLQTRNHEWLMITRNAEWLTKRPKLSVQARATDIEGPSDAWFCDPWYWHAGCQGYRDAGVAYSIKEWSRYGPQILANAGDSVVPEIRCDIIQFFQTTGPGAAPKEPIQIPATPFRPKGF